MTTAVTSASKHASAPTPRSCQHLLCSNGGAPCPSSARDSMGSRTEHPPRHRLQGAAATVRILALTVAPLVLLTAHAATVSCRNAVLPTTRREVEASICTATGM